MPIVRQSTELLPRLFAASEKQERDALVDQLAALDDPCAIAPLWRMLNDRSAADAHRTDASRTLLRMVNAPALGDAELRRWWAGADVILQRHALSSMTQPQRDLVESVLDRPDHALHLDAVETLQFGFDGPWVSQRLIAALTHGRAAVRATAAELLVWEEPVAATAPLIAATRDPDRCVVEWAFNTLCYYPTHATVGAAHALLEHTDEGIRDSARNCLRWVREEFISSLAVRDHEDFIRAWAAPIWPMLAISEQDIADQRASAQDLHARQEPEATEWLASAPRLREFLAGLDCSVAARESLFYGAGWSHVPDALRPAIAHELLQTTDAIARRCFARVFGTWRFREGLVRLLDDVDYAVRRAAMYYLRELRPDAQLAQRAWAHLPDAFGADAYETLETAIALSESNAWIPTVTRLVQASELSAELRSHAVWALGKARASHALEDCLLLLEEPPHTNWGLHSALIDAALDLGVPLPDLRGLRDADHLAVQRVLARVEHHRQ